MRDFTEEQIAAARRMVRDYWNRCDMVWDDMLFELGIREGLTDDEAERLISDHT